ncbi:MAG TPA: glycosyltransferase family 39 protein [Ktedonobacteraceae bacterium]|nr:glycosyltransferase family 39 protein [Ktedonobacteraceae bacterium]
MIDTPITTREDLPGQPEAISAKNLSPWWRRLALAAVTLVSAFMNFYQLGTNGWANTYYAAAIRSMLDSWHNFFYVSFDPGGFVSVDKPPLGFWLQAASAKVFGFTPFSVFLPQALAGALSVLLLYHLVRRHFGVIAGLLAALALAISPISVLANRNNTIDSTLALVMLLGAWAVLKAAETGKLRWLLLCAVTVGLGFNIKMLEAYLVVPAYALLYLLAAPRRLWVRLAHLALAGLLMLTISLSWAVAVDLTPASSRPYVGSSQDNSEISLALGYNGIQRLLGQFGFGGNAGNASNTGNSSTTTGDFPPGGFGNGAFPRDFPADFQGPPQGFGGGNGGPDRNGNGGGMFNTGNPGLTRLFNEPLGGQIVWLLPMALMGMLALAWKGRPRFRDNPEMQSLVLWGTWLLTMAVFFSVATFFHQYYLTTFAPAICALFGIGVVVMWRDYLRAGWRGWLLPIALVLTAIEQMHIITSNPSWGLWLIPAIAIPTLVGAAVLVGARLLPRLRLERRFLGTALGIALLGLLLTSAVWSAIPVLADQAANLPVAGPTSSGAFAGASGGNGNLNVNTALINYLEAHRNGAKYLVAVASSQEADGIILATNQPVMALGGFSGSDPILTTSQLAALVKNGTVRFFLINGNGGGPGGGQSALTSWITSHCTLVSSSQYQSTSTGSGFGGGQLYEYTGA